MTLVGCRRSKPTPIAATAPVHRSGYMESAAAFMPPGAAGESLKRRDEQRVIDGRSRRWARTIFGLGRRYTHLIVRILTCHDAKKREIYPRKRITTEAAAHACRGPTTAGIRRSEDGDTYVLMAGTIQVLARIEERDDAGDAAIANWGPIGRPRRS